MCTPVVGEVAEDRGVGQRVAVELARRRGRDAARRGLLVRAGSGRSTPRRRAGCPRTPRAGSCAAPQPGEPGEQEVDLQLRAGGLRIARRLLAQQAAAAPTAPRWPARAAPAPCGCRQPSCQVDLGAVRRRPGSALTAGVGQDLGAARRARPSQERLGDRAHAADGHPPLAGAVADQVVEEAAVLDQRRVVQVGEGADQRVGRDHAAHQVVGEALARSTSPSGRSTTLIPDRSAGHLPAQRRRQRRQGGGQGRRDDAGEVGDLGVEGAPGVVLLVGAGERAERLAASPRPRRARRTGRGARPSRTVGEYDAVRASAARGGARARGRSARAAARPGRSTATAARPCPGNASALTAAPPVWPSRSSTSTESPAPARYAAAVSPLWPPPTTTTS